MQGSHEENSTENVPSIIGDSQNPALARGSVASNEPQRDDETNNVYQLLGQTTTELHKQLNLLQERAESCIRVKDKALQEEKRQRRYLLESMLTLKAEIEYWKNMADKKTIELKDKALEEEKMKCERLQKNCRTAESELTYWKMFAESRTKSCAELADKKTIELKEKALEEEKMKSEQLEKNLRKAEAEVTHWKMLAEMKTKSCDELVDKLVKARRLYKKEKDKYPEEEHSFTGDNGDDLSTKHKKKDNEEDESDPWRGWRKRPRV